MVDPPKALWFTVFIIAVQQIEENLFYPRVVGNDVGLSGMWVLVAMLLFGGLFGITGIVLAVPVMAVLYTLLSEWVNARIKKKEELSLEETAAEEESPD
jgi:predicted PurR-regulated permease PerM